MSTIWIILQFAFFFGLLVFFHELGHFLASYGRASKSKSLGSACPAF